MQQLHISNIIRNELNAPNFMSGTKRSANFGNSYNQKQILEFIVDIYAQKLKSDEKQN